MQALPEPLDTSALTRPFPGHEVRAQWPAFVAEDRDARDRIGRLRRLTTTLGALGGLFGIFFFGLVGLLAYAQGGRNAGGIAFGMGTLVVVMILLAVILVRMTVRVWSRRTLKRTHLRLAAFAQANGFDYRVGPIALQRDMPWWSRGSANLHRVFRSREPRGIEMANYEVIGNRKNLAAPFGGYCALRMPVALPHILLRAQDGRRRGMTGAGAPADAQRLSLEGGFDRHFQLYCPIGYEADALYLFTPDVMARLLDHVRGFDVEIVDDWLLLVTTKDLVTTRPEDWRDIADAVDALDDRVERWARWRETRGDRRSAAADESASTKTAAGRVSTRGRRLAVRMSLDDILMWSALALFVVGLVFGLLR
ncbi:hypothetical protein [Plantibacter sp. Leaf314]|uniref:hypothetical protein n=1 Tax=Plantibacter sp. Leaf314 TaxID=1736333 RepID=UPI0006F31876|nr:hypothetical protein [Plantibacter sp. Leaf314]KQQ49679.1 hypothetical protein ASF68_17725 [Plantibacter sp. Leaf314]